MSHTKADIAKSIAHKHQLNLCDVKQFIDLYLEEIKSQLGQQHNVRISGFGQFEIREKNARRGRNPWTGEASMIAARKVVKFKPGKYLKPQPIEDDA